MLQPHHKPVIVTDKLGRTFKQRGNKNIVTGFFDPQWKYTTAVKNLDLSVNQGESVAFLGPNGAGKTTTMKMLSGLLYPTSGMVRVLDFSPVDRKPDYLKQIGFVMGNKSGLNWDLTPEQNFWLLKKVYQISDEDFDTRKAFLVDMLGVSHIMQSQTRQLSLGERLKCELMAALLHGPKVLFLDEPTIGLDIDSKAELRKFLKKLIKEEQITLLLTSHDMDDIEGVCERVVVINHGKKIYDDSLHELQKQYASKKYLQLIFEAKPDENALKDIGEILCKAGNTYHIEIADNHSLKKLSSLFDDDNLIDIQIESVPLEEIISDVFQFRNLTT